MTEKNVLQGIIIDEVDEFSLGELSRACGQSTEWIITLVEEGVIEPLGDKQLNWRFRGNCLRKVKIVQRLQTDLGVNLAGAALALDLLDEVESLRARLQRMEKW